MEDKVEDLGTIIKNSKKKKIVETMPIKGKKEKLAKIGMFYGKLGGDVNRIAAQTGIAKNEVEQIIKDEKL